MLLRALALSVLSSFLSCSGGRYSEPYAQPYRQPPYPQPPYAQAPYAQPQGNELSPGVVLPTKLGEGHGDGEADPDLAGPAGAASAGAGGGPALSGSAAAAPAPAASAANPDGSTRRDPPDPEPLRLAEQWEYELQMKSGKLSVLATRPRKFKQPIVTARRFGRYAIELWIGKELVERVRFDLPGLAPEGPEPAPGQKQPLYGPPTFARGVEVRQKVLVPAAPRARQARLIDRATGAVSPLPWPPEAPSEGASPPASAAPAASTAPASSR